MHNGVNQLLDTQELQNELAHLIPQAKEITIISAYITDIAIDWMLNKIQDGASVRVIARLSPQDFLSGASTFNAIKTLLNAKHEIRLLANLHAKIYLINQDTAFVGSANLTNNGLKLFSRGNIEASIRIDVTPDVLKFVNNIGTKSIGITLDILEKMEQVLTTKSKNTPLEWSEDIIGCSLELWTVDMLQEEMTSSNIINGKDQILLFGDTVKVNQSDIEFYFKKTKIYKWLIKELDKEESKTMSFGKISQSLHNAINDDPLPYRKTIKEYVKNLLSYCQLFALDKIEISRPNYSEIIKLKKDEDYFI